MKNISYTMPYPIGTYLTKREDGIIHLDQVNKYVIDKDGLSAILTLDVEINPRLSIPISIGDLLQNWKEDTRIIKKRHSLTRKK